MSDMKNPSSATITISRMHSPNRAIAGRDMLTELGYEDATVMDAQKVFDAMLYVPGSPPEYHDYDAQMAFETRLLMLVAEIRQITGVGQKPTLSDLAEAIRSRITALETELAKQRDAVLEAAEGFEGREQVSDFKIRDTRADMARLVLVREIEKTKAELAQHREDARTATNIEFKTGSRVFASHAASKLETLEWALKGMESVARLTALEAELDAEKAKVVKLRKAMVEIRDRKARNILPWTHEQAADEYARMLDADRMTARRIHEETA